MTLGILCAMRSEAALIADKLTGRRTETVGGNDYFLGSLCGTPAVLAVSGIGKVNAALCSALLLDHFHADCVINSGIAGAMQDGLRPLDVVLCEAALYHDAEEEMLLCEFPFKNEFEAGEALLRLAEKACDELSIPYTTGRAATGDQLIADRVVKKRIADAFHPACVDMESAAVAHVCFAMNKPFLAVRTMSDTGEEGLDMINEFEERAAAASAGIIIKMAELIK